jgi:hypothetical protein
MNMKNPSDQQEQITADLDEMFEFASKDEAARNRERFMNALKAKHLLTFLHAAPRLRTV